MKRRLAYLSGAPRVSTSPEAVLGGPRSHVLGVISGFEAAGWEVRRFIVGDRVPRSWVGVGSERVVARSWFRALAADLLRLVMGPIYTRQSWRTLGAESDWVYERFAIFQAMGKIFKRHGKLWILETNGLAHQEARDRHTLALTGLAKRLEFRAYQRCDCLVCVSSTLKEMILDRVEIPAGKVVVMPNGVDTSLFDPAKHDPIRLFEGFTVGYAGSLTPQQNVDLVLEAAHELANEDISIHLVVVGDGPMRETWETLATAMGLSSRVRFVGQVRPEAVPGYIQGFDVGYLGHKVSDGPIFYSPLKLYEYMVMAVPVVASRLPDTQRVVKDGETGFLFQARSKEQLKHALRRAYDQRAGLPEMGQQARQRVMDNESWVSRVSTLIAYIESRE